MKLNYKLINKFFFRQINSLILLDKFKRRIILSLIDVFLVYFSFLITLWESGLDNFNDKSWIFNYLVIISLICYFATGFYRGISKYIVSKFLYLLVLRNILIIVILLFTCLLNSKSLPSTAFVFLLFKNQILSIAFFRFLARDFLILISKNYKKIRVVIYGAGESAAQLAASLRLNNNYKVLFFIDDRDEMKDRNIYGIPIKKSSILKDFRGTIDEIFLAKSNLKKYEKKRIVLDAQDFDIKIKEIPSIDEISFEKVNFKNLRKINIEDILGRDINLKESELIDSKSKFKNILITGAGGSIGSELSKQLINLNPKKIILFDVSEASLYTIHQEILSLKNISVEVVPILGNATNRMTIENIIRIHEVDLILHAAAYKHVPLVEVNPLEGIFNNVFSTKIICEASIKFNVSQMMLISSDKAVRPTNIMGASKRLAELIVQAYADKFSNSEKKSSSKTTKFSIVRFGNVLGSSGSVVPLFEKQIRDGGPITLTDERVIRFFMTISEAVQLVIQAVFITKSGEIFLLDMGEPIKIKDLAKQMIKLSGLTIKDLNNPQGDIEIKCTGLRDGEKLYEELLIDNESIKTQNKYIFKAIEKFIPFDEL